MALCRQPMGSGPGWQCPTRSDGSPLLEQHLESGPQLSHVALTGPSATAKVTEVVKAECFLLGWGASYCYWPREAQGLSRGRVLMEWILEMLPGEREGFQTLSKSGSDILSSSKENKETASQLREEIIIQKGVNIQGALNKHLLSPGISFNTLTYLKWRRKSHPTLVSLPSQHRDICVVCPWERDKQQRNRERK